MRIKNWKEFQHFKDRNPPWVKLHRQLLDNPDWHKLSPVDSKILIMLWLLASEDKDIQGKLPNVQTIAFRLRLPCEKITESLKSLSKWITLTEAPKKEKWASRYISKEVREIILKRDNYKCVFCAASSALEIDHVIPVSKGGTSEQNNLQVLCRSCNRKKRASVTRATQNTVDAT